MPTIALSTTPPPSITPHRTPSAPLRHLPLSPLRHLPPLRPSVSCNVALKSDPHPSSASAPSSDELESTRLGAKVRVKAPLKVYHVPKVDQVDLLNQVGTLKQYVGVWKGKRISANLPFKVEFVVDIEGRGPVKFFAHLKDDEFEYVD